MTERRPSAWVARPHVLRATSAYFDRLSFVGAFYNRHRPVEARDLREMKVSPVSPNFDLTAALAALSDPSRRLVYERLVVRPSRVGEIAESVDLSRPAVSHHVSGLLDAGLISQNDAKVLSVVVEHLPRLRAYFDRLWIEASLGDTWLRERTSSLHDEEA